MSSYNKLFPFQDSSLIELDIHVRYVFLFMLGHCDFFGYIDGSRQSLARRANVPQELMDDALEILQRPDPDSRTREEEGRRIIYQGSNRWLVVNKTKYRMKEGSEYKKFQDRLRQARKRCIDAGEEWNEEEWVRQDVAKNNNLSRDSRHVDVDVDVDVGIVPTVHVVNSKSNISNNSKDTDSKDTVIVESRVPVAKKPPTVEEIYEYFIDKGYSKKDPRVLKLAETIVEHHSNGGKWRQKNGKPIYVWKTHALQWAQNHKLPRDLMADSREKDKVIEMNRRKNSAYEKQK